MINLCKHLYGQKRVTLKDFFQEIPLIRINIFALKTTSDFFVCVLYSPKRTNPGRLTRHLIKVLFFIRVIGLYGRGIG